VEPDNMQTTRRMFIRTTAATTAAFAAAPLALGRLRTGDPKPAADATAKPAANKLKILILGGTAFLGPELVETAQARGHALTLFNRGKTRPNLFPDVEKLRGDRDPNKGEGLKALEGDRTWDAVIDTSGDYPRMVKASADLLAPRVGQYVFVSSISVYKGSSKPGSDETASASPARGGNSRVICSRRYVKIRRNSGCTNPRCTHPAPGAHASAGQ
jgi:2'-hydroxyisoflavone reductase